ncbi:hypothetical protein [Clostridium baratii]|uniref:hypothetical protein n=1 Tax=Clostridium baratii TaxID=1561 RepID=UPI0005F27E5C|nr:hypothetical protein [Clostridium baratii]KJU70833.1 hypothetical protein UC77_13245 [Clostridium baratii]
MRKRAILVAGALVGAILVGLSGIKDIEDNRTKNSRTNTLIQEGLAKIEDNKLEEAIQIFDRVLEVDPSNKEAMELRQTAQNTISLLDSNDKEEYKRIKESFEH